MGSTLAAPTMGSPLPQKSILLLFRKRHDRPHCHSVVQAKMTEKSVANFAFDHCSVSSRRTKQAPLPKSPWSLFYRLLSHYLPKFVLEVMGGAGAVWGFSEACGVRRPETVYFWRPAALVVGGIFFVRFLKELFMDMAALRSSTYDSKCGKADLELTCTTTSSTIMVETSSSNAPMTTTTSSPANCEEPSLSPTEMKALTSNVNVNLPPVPSVAPHDTRRVPSMQ